jgi:GTP-binding protein Era
MSRSRGSKRPVVGPAASTPPAAPVTPAVPVTAAAPATAAAQAATTPFRAGTIAIVGRPNVGKSTLLNYLVGQKISITSRKPQTTRQRILGIRTTDDAQYVFVDTPGFQTRHASALTRLMNQSVTVAMAGVDAVIHVIEAGRWEPGDAQVAKLLPPGLPVVLALNKTDRLKDRAKLGTLMAERAAAFSYAALVPVSAQKGTQLNALLAEVRKLLPEQPALYGEDELTDRSERFLAAEFIREKLFRLLGEELPYACSVVIEKFEQEGRLRRIFAAVIVDKANQKGIVLGEGGEKMKRIATEARLDLEKLFGGKVYLEVWVKVKSGWADDERVLRSLGYE